MRRAVVPALVSTLVLALAAEACGDDSEGTGRPSPARGAGTPYEVTTSTETFVDRSRPTVVTGSSPIAPDRSLVTTITYPRSERGPFPLIVLAHGFNGHPDRFGNLVAAWAQGGYVVAAPAFPLTNVRSAAGTFVPDYANQPADVSFVIDELLRLSRRDEGPIGGLVDRERIGVAGLSLGAATTFGVVFHSCCRDERIDAAITMAGVVLPFEGEYDVSGVPVLMAHGDADPALPYSGSRDAYEMAAAPKYLLTVLGGGHAPPFEDTPDPADEAVTRTTSWFWDAYLADRPGSARRLLAGADVPGVTRLDHET